MEQNRAIMPEVDGLEATRAIRRTSSSRARPWIVAVTANVTPEDRLRCFDAGMNDYLAKPVSLEKLVDALRRISASPASRTS